MKKVANLFILFAAMAVGGVAVKFWDDAVQRGTEKLIEAQLMRDVRQPNVDIHKIGLHGPFIDLHVGHLLHEGEVEGEHDDDVHLTPDQMKRLREAEAKAKEVFGTPGGAYTKEDIAKNGTIPPAQRFGDVQFLYTMKAFPGQATDPILGTKVSGAFDWYVGGQCYHFASVPSLEEFVMRAKKDPSSVMPASHYVGAKTVQVAQR